MIDARMNTLVFHLKVPPVWIAAAPVLPPRNLTQTGALSAVTRSCGTTNFSGRSWVALADPHCAQKCLFTIQRCSDVSQVTSGLEHPGS